MSSLENSAIEIIYKTRPNIAGLNNNILWDLVDYAQKQSMWDGFFMYLNLESDRYLAWERLYGMIESISKPETVDTYISFMTYLIKLRNNNKSKNSYLTSIFYLDNIFIFAIKYGTKEIITHMMQNFDPDFNEEAIEFLENHDKLHGTNYVDLFRKFERKEDD